MAVVAQVQIVTRSEERRRSWGAALAAAGLGVIGPSDMSPDALPDVVLTDLPFSAQESDAAAPPAQGGMVYVASASDILPGKYEGTGPFVDLEGPPRVALPADASVREIVLACQLLAPIVRLRRSQRDATERETRWKRLADTDPLTGLMNRRAFTEQLLSFLRSAGGAQSCCLALLDLDRFKPVNDEIGHSAGDALLRQVAERLTAGVRKGDLVCRLGGDEFALALFGAPPDIAGKLVERLRQAVGGEDAEAGYRIAASAGWAMLPIAAETNAAQGTIHSDHQAETLYQQAFEAADANLRAAKSAGRNQTIPC